MKLFQIQRTPSVKIRVLELGASNQLFGAERWILALARYLDPVSFEVTVSVTQDSNDGHTELIDAARALGLRTGLIRARGRFDPRMVTKLVRAIRSDRFDLVHSHGYKTDTLAYLATRLTGARWISTPHGWSTQMDWKLKAYVYLGSRILRFADAVAPLSEVLCADMNLLGVPEERNHLILNGVDLDEVREATPVSRASLGLNGDFVVGYIGQLIPRKRVAILIEAFALFQQRVPNSKLLVVGCGEEEESLKCLVGTLQLSGQVNLLGFRPDRLSLLKVFDVFVLPSELEGIPRCLMEAMLAGVTVVATQISGTTDLVKDGVTGLTFKPGDTQHLCSVLERAWRDSELTKSLQSQAKHLVENRFSAKRMASEYGRLFQELLESKR